MKRAPITLGALVHWPTDPTDVGEVVGDGLSVQWANHTDRIDANGYLLGDDGERLRRGPRGRFLGPVKVVGD